MIYLIYSIVTIVILLVVTIFAGFVFIGVARIIHWLYILRIPTFNVARVLPMNEVSSAYWNKVGRIISTLPNGSVKLQFMEMPDGIFKNNHVAIYNNEFRDLYEANRLLNSGG